MKIVVSKLVPTAYRPLIYTVAQIMVDNLYMDVRKLIVGPIMENDDSGSMGFATYCPVKKIAVVQFEIKNSPLDVLDTLAHELVHISQYSCGALSIRNGWVRWKNWIPLPYFIYVWFHAIMPFERQANDVAEEVCFQALAEFAKINNMTLSDSLDYFLQSRS